MASRSQFLRQVGAGIRSQDQDKPPSALMDELRQSLAHLESLSGEDPSAVYNASVRVAVLAGQIGVLATRQEAPPSMPATDEQRAVAAGINMFDFLESIPTPFAYWLNRAVVGLTSPHNVLPEPYNDLRKISLLEFTERFTSRDLRKQHQVGKRSVEAFREALPDGIVLRDQ